MAQTSSAARGSGVLLFDEDFDLPPAPAEPEVIQPLFTAAELMAAREEAVRECRDATIAEVDASVSAASRRALSAIASQMEAARDEAALIAEQSAEAITGLLLDCFATAFPALSTRHGPGEITAVLQAILPALHREPKITVRVHPGLLAQVTQEIHALDADLAARVRLVATDTTALGDTRVTWENGAATRNAVSLWGQIENILAPIGLLNSADPSRPDVVPDTEQIPKEHELVE